MPQPRCNLRIGLFSIDAHTNKNVDMSWMTDWLTDWLTDWANTRDAAASKKLPEHFSIDVGRL